MEDKSPNPSPKQVLEEKDSSAHQSMNSDNSFNFSSEAKILGKDFLNSHYGEKSFESSPYNQQDSYSVQKGEIELQNEVFVSNNYRNDK